MRVLVTGACGMLGRLVSRGLEEHGHHVIPTDVLDGCELMDISDTGVVFDVINRTRPEMVIHCAAMTDVDGCTREPDKAFKLNGVGTWNIACACAAVHAALLYISTDYVFDGEKSRPYTEFDQPNPLSPYGASKLAGEEAVRELCRKHYVVRTSWVFAPHGKNFPISILRAAQSKQSLEAAAEKKLTVVSDQFGSPTYAKDLAGFVVSMVGSPLYGTYHYTNAGSCSWYEFAKTILETAGIDDVEVVPIRSEDWPTPTRRPKNSILRHYRMELLGRDAARSWQDAVAEFIKEWNIAKQ